jgi:hypothetical protein
MDDEKLLKQRQYNRSYYARNKSKFKERSLIRKNLIIKQISIPITILREQIIIHFD